ncbi:MAG: DUF6174 domain-containing protein [Anaerolineaceae bacterium]|nr:DUF6174 domain-containing protein [Anaerolineaceae bacterium]
MNRFVYKISFILLILFSTVSCSVKSDHPDESPILTATPISIQQVQQEYTKALQRWENKKVVDYEITVNVYSSFEVSPCSMKAVLVVRNNKLATINELETEVPLELRDKTLAYNPECHDYEQYTISAQFELLDKILKGELNLDIYKLVDIHFDPEYGYITHLLFGSEETVKDIKTSNFNPTNQ